MNGFILWVWFMLVFTLRVGENMIDKHGMEMTVITPSVGIMHM